jgi:hypothetical protein
MTIHDILVNCGSVESDTLITIISGSYRVIRQCFFKNLETKYGALHFNYFTVRFMMWNGKPKLSIKFYV